MSYMGSTAGLLGRLTTALQAAAVSTRIREAAHGRHRERVFTMDLTPNGRLATVVLDGDDISGLVRGVEVRAAVDEATQVRLDVGVGQHVQLRARLPEAAVSIAVPVETIEIALEIAFGRVGARCPTDIHALAIAVLLALEDPNRDRP